MNRKEQICISILRALKLAGEFMVREDVLARSVVLELRHIQVNYTELKDCVEKLERDGKIRSERDGYDVVRFVLSESGRAELLAKGL